jgi:predicted NodU family carbamoyl transferase
MIILGLNAFHADLQPALVRDGKLIAATEEERFRFGSKTATMTSPGLPRRCMRRHSFTS